MSKRPRRNSPSIGSVSSGTMRPEDLIPSFVWELEYLKGGSKFRSLVRAANRLKWDDTEFPGPYYSDPEEADGVLDSLFDALQELCLPYMMFGASEGDGADYGFWPCVDSVQEDVQNGDVHDYDNLPEKVSIGDLACQVSDHGNVTLLRRYKRKWREVWSCV